MTRLSYPIKIPVNRILVITLFLLSVTSTWGLGGNWPVTPYQKLQYQYIIGQKSSESCGAATFLTLFSKFYQAEISKQKIRNSYLQPETRGVTLLDLKQVSKNLGVPARGFRLPTDELVPVLNDIDHPVILYYNQLYKHFVLAVAGWNDTIIVADPTWGLIAISHQDLIRSWKGLILAFAPPVKLRKSAISLVQEIRVKERQKVRTLNLARSGLIWVQKFSGFGSES